MTLLKKKIRRIKSKPVERMWSYSFSVDVIQTNYNWALAILVNQLNDNQTGIRITMPFTEKAFGEYRAKLQETGFILIKINRVPYAIPEKCYDKAVSNKAVSSAA